MLRSKYRKTFKECEARKNAVLCITWLVIRFSIGWYIQRKLFLKADIISVGGRGGGRINKVLTCLSLFILSFSGRQTQDLRKLHPTLDRNELCRYDYHREGRLLSGTVLNSLQRRPILQRERWYYFRLEKWSPAICILGRWNWQRVRASQKNNFKGPADRLKEGRGGGREEVPPPCPPLLPIF